MVTTTNTALVLAAQANGVDKKLVKAYVTNCFDEISYGVSIANSISNQQAAISLNNITC